MRAVVFGQSGLEKDAYLGEVQACAKREGKNFTILNTGKYMQSIDSLHRDPQLFPSFGVAERETLRTQALESILRKVEEDPQSDYVLNAHAVFRLQTGLISAADVDLLRKFSPEIVIVLIDDFYVIHRRLRDSPPYQALKQSAILEWRDAEIMTSRTVAQQLFPNPTSNERQFFVVARAHHPCVLYRLFYERRSRKRIYCSFAITGATPEQKARIQQFKNRLGEKHIVFDPFKIVERIPCAVAIRSLTQAAQRLKGSKSVVKAYDVFTRSLIRRGIQKLDVSVRKEFTAVDVLPGLIQLEFSPPGEHRIQREDVCPEEMFKPYRFTLDELVSLTPIVDGQILSRDYLLIDQSEMVCALVPLRKGKPEVSAGSQSELTYAKLAGKPRYVVCEGPWSEVSLWVAGHADRQFDTIEQLGSFLLGGGEKWAEKEKSLKSSG